MCLCGFTDETPNERHVPVLMYHSVCKTNVGEFVISPERLRADFAYLKAHGYTAVFVRDVIAFCDGTGDLPPKPVVLSFDDGFYNNLFYAEKIAEEHDMKMTIAVVGAYTQKEQGETKRSPVYSYLSPAELQAMQARGRVEFINHTYDLHKIANGRKGVRRKKGESIEAYEALLRADSEKCRALIANACNADVNVFAYPFGSYSAGTVEILRKLGYRAMLTCKGGINTFRKGDPSGLTEIMRYNRPGTVDTQTFFSRCAIR